MEMELDEGYVVVRPLSRIEEEIGPKVLLVARVAERRRNPGDDSVKLVLKDTTFSVHAYVSPERLRVAGFAVEANDVVRVRGERRVSSANKIYVQVEHLERVESLTEDDKKALFGGGRLPPEAVDLRFKRILDSIRKSDPSLGELVEEVLRSYAPEALRSRPAGVRMHHSSVGGLLEHTVEVAELGRAIARKYSRIYRIDEGVLLAAAVLHDVGKLKEIREDHRIGLEGRVLGHLAYGLMAVQSAVERISSRGGALPEERKLLNLLHCLASHHGEVEKGALVRPMTAEAIILHYADEVSAELSKREQAWEAHLADRFYDQSLADQEGIYQGLERDRRYWRFELERGEDLAEEHKG